jgi:hypothetical protein
MLTRFVAIFPAVFAAALIAAPVKTLARGGYSGDHALAFHDAVGRPIGRPAIAHIDGFPHFRDHRRFYEAPWYDGYDGSSDYVAPDDQPQPNPSTVESSARLPRSSCTEQTYKVPSEAGGERSVKVVRC